MDNVVMKLLMGGLQKIKLYTGAALLVLAFTALLAPFALFIIFLIVGIAMMANYYMDVQKERKELMTPKTDEQLELEINGGKP